MIFIVSSFAQLSDAEFEILKEKEDIIILDENMKVSFVDQRASYIRVFVEKEITYQIITEKGNNYLLPYTLPVRFDELYLPHNSSIRNEQRLFDDILIEKFEISLLNPDGSLEKVEAQRKAIENQIVTNHDRFGKIYSYHYTFPAFNPGETFQISYKYSFPFRLNWEKMFSTRVFLDTKIPRKKFDLKWSHHYYLEVDTNYVNGAIPQWDTLNNYVYLSWHRENQPGALDEPGARPHTNLEWFTFTPKPYEFLYEHYNSFKEEFIPFWYYLSIYREYKVRNAIVDFQIGAKDKDNLRFDKIAKKYIDLTPDDSTGITRLRYFQRYVVDSTKYDDDFKRFNKEEEYKRDHPGTELYGGIIKEPQKEFIYASIIPKLDHLFFTAYPADARMGYIGQAFYAPMLDNEFLFAVILKDNTLAYLMPKSDIRNMYCEELPFYYENSPVMLLFTFDYAGYKRNYNDVLRLVDLPGSTAAENTRKTNSIAKVNLVKGEINFVTHISLAGQYSTMTRNIYKDGTVDSTVNAKYFEKVWEFGGDYKINNVEVSATDYFFPFRTSIDVNFSSMDLIKKQGDHFELDLSGWIKHIFYEGLDAEHRFTDFYPDFTGNDTYAFMIEFDQPVSFIDLPESFEIDNDFGTYNFSLKPMSESKLLINSYFLTKTPMVKKEDIDQVANIYNAIEKTQLSKIRISIK
jgi:hypothetical protein